MLRSPCQVILSTGSTVPSKMMKLEIMLTGVVTLHIAFALIYAIVPNTINCLYGDAKGQYLPFVVLFIALSLLQLTLFIHHFFSDLFQLSLQFGHSFGVTTATIKKLIKKAQTPVTAFLFFLLFECLCLME